MQLKSSRVSVSGVCTGHCGGKGRGGHTTFSAQKKKCFCERKLACTKSLQTNHQDNLAINHQSVRYLPVYPTVDSTRPQNF